MGMYCDFVLISGYLLIIFAEFCVFIVNLIYLWTYMIFCFLLCLLSSVYFFCFVLILHIWYFVPTVCVSEIVIVDITLCGLTCGYAYASGTCDINLRTPFGDEYVCGLQTHLRIVPLLDSWVWFFVMNCGICFSYCFCFVSIFRTYFASILRVWSTFTVDCTLRRIETKCC